MIFFPSSVVFYLDSPPTTPQPSPNNYLMLLMQVSLHLRNDPSPLTIYLFNPLLVVRFRLVPKVIPPPFLKGIPLAEIVFFPLSCVFISFL